MLASVNPIGSTCQNGRCAGIGLAGLQENFERGWGRDRVVIHDPYEVGTHSHCSGNSGSETTGATVVLRQSDDVGNDGVRGNELRSLVAGRVINHNNAVERAGLCGKPVKSFT